MAVKAHDETKKCRFGRQHTWQTALAAAVNSNEGADLPDEPAWVFWCSACGMLGPWSVHEAIYGADAESGGVH